MSKLKLKLPENLGDVLTKDEMKKSSRRRWKL